MSGSPMNVVYRFNPVARAFDEVADAYDDLYRDKVSRIEDMLVGAALHNQPVPVLDIGCGTGLLLDLANIPPDGYLGIDISHRMVERARKKHPDYTFKVMDLGDLARVSPDRRFNTIAALYGPLSYMEHLALDARRMHAFLRPGGRLVAMGYSRRHARRRSAIENTCGIPATRYYQAAYLEALFRASGFAKVRVTGLSWPWSDALSFLPEKTLLSLMIRGLQHARPDAGYHLIVTARA